MSAVQTIPDTLHSPAEVHAAADAFRRDGYVVLEDALPEDFVAELRDEYLAALDRKVAAFRLARTDVRRDGGRFNRQAIVAFEPRGGNHDVNRWNMHLPSRRPFLDDRVVAHPVVTGVLDRVLGPDCFAFLLASDTPFPGADDQVIHRDFPRYGITLNVPLVDFTEDNAPLEIWPGTHQNEIPTDAAAFSTAPVPVAGEEVGRLAQLATSRRMLLKAGSILLRDQRLIHRGTAHRGTEPRPCLSLWFKDPCGFAPRQLSIPTPYRFAANWTARTALRIRERGRGDGSRVNTRMVNIGNRVGMFTDELACSDRDERRRIPANVWHDLSPRARHLLRYAEVEGMAAPSPRRSLFGSGLLLGLGLAGKALATLASLRRAQA